LPIEGVCIVLAEGKESTLLKGFKHTADDLFADCLSTLRKRIH